MRNKWYLLLAAVFCLIASGNLKAEVISVDFNRRSQDAFTGLAAAPDAAGATAVWNQSSARSPVNASLDSTGTVTAVVLSIENDFTFSNDEGDQELNSGHHNLFVDYLFSSDRAGDLRTGSWSGLVPGGSYDLYFYGQGDNFESTSASGGQNVGIRIGTDVRHTSFDGVSGNGPFELEGPGGDGNLVEDIEYVVFRGIVADASGTINFEYFNPGTGVHATDPSFFDSDTGSVDLDGNASRFHALNGVQIVGEFPAALKGDVNRDGVADLFDIAPFIAILTTPGAFQAEADIDCSREVNLFDIAPLITILTSP